MSSTRIDTAAGQVLVGGIEGTVLAPEDRVRLADGRLGGLILFARNIESPRQVNELLATAARSAAPGWPPALLGVDQEGGRVARLKAPLLELPPARRLGEIDDPELTRRAARALGAQLRAVGFSLDFAPVLDVDGGSARAVIGDRSFSSDPEVAARHGEAVVRGLVDAGICPCGKHFPGHGITEVDSHIDLPRVGQDRGAEVRRRLGPFARAIAAGLPAIMPAHVVYECWDPDRPATCSQAILGDLLRVELGFAGAIISDDLNMGAVLRAGGPEEVAVEALAAGADLVMVCRGADLEERVRARVAEAARRSPALARRLLEAADRARGLRTAFVPSPVQASDLVAVLDSPESRAVTLELESRRE
jgi:beta-N-acetylhexosaminidase